MASLAGRLWYQAWHRPRAGWRECVLAGGPWEQYLTWRGRRAMERAAAGLPPAEASGPAIAVHVLTGRRYWYQSAFCLHSFAATARRSVAPVFYDDGSLTQWQQSALRRTFPAASFVTQQEAKSRLAERLPPAEYPVLHERWQVYPNIRKLIDPHLAGGGWKLVLDSDLLFFRSPKFIVDWLAAPSAPLHAVDTTSCYGYSDSLLAALAGAAIPERVNVGICGLRSDDVDWRELEKRCRTLIEREGTHYFLEQAIVAMLVAGRPAAVAPEADYITHPSDAEAARCSAVMHHYVAGSKRWYFRRNWRRVLTRP